MKKNSYDFYEIRRAAVEIRYGACFGFLDLNKGELAERLVDLDDRRTSLERDFTADHTREIEWLVAEIMEIADELSR